MNFRTYMELHRLYPRAVCSGCRGNQSDGMPIGVTDIHAFPSHCGMPPCIKVVQFGISTTTL